MPTSSIYNYRKVNDRVITGGQPTEEQLRAAAAAEGVQAVINLAVHNPEHSLPDEGGVVRAAGMEYHHIPVDWGNPLETDFAEFEKAIGEVGGRKVLIHCAANFRVTAFFGLYALKNLGWTEAEAEAFRAPIWQGSDYPVWEEFIRMMRAKILAGKG